MLPAVFSAPPPAALVGEAKHHLRNLKVMLESIPHGTDTYHFVSGALAMGEQHAKEAGGLAAVLR